MKSISYRCENEKSQLIFRRVNSLLSQLILALHSQMQELDFSQSFLFYSADMKYFPLSCCFRNNFAITCHWWISLEFAVSSLLHITLFLPHSPKHEPSAYTSIKMFFLNLELPRDGVTNYYNFYVTKTNKNIQDQSTGIHF